MAVAGAVRFTQTHGAHETYYKVQTWMLRILGLPVNRCNRPVVYALFSEPVGTTAANGLNSEPKAAVTSIHETSLNELRSSNK